MLEGAKQQKDVCLSASLLGHSVMARMTPALVTGHAKTFGHYNFHRTSLSTHQIDETYHMIRVLRISIVGQSESVHSAEQKCNKCNSLNNHPATLVRIIRSQMYRLFSWIRISDKENSTKGNEIGHWIKCLPQKVFDLSFSWVIHENAHKLTKWFTANNNEGLAR